MPRIKIPEFIRVFTIKDYIFKKKGMRSRDEAAGDLVERINSTIEVVINDARDLAKEEGRKTIMRRHMVSSLDKHLGKEALSWEEILEGVLSQNPIDLGKISKGINDYIARTKKG